MRPMDNARANRDQNPASCWRRMHHRKWDELRGLVLQQGFRHMVYRLLKTTRQTEGVLRRIFDEQAERVRAHMAQQRKPKGKK